MTLNDIITKNLHLIDSQGNITMTFVKEVAKQYAEIFARKSLEKAAGEVFVDYDLPKHLYELIKDDIEVFALHHSITDIELPSHE